MFEHHTSRTPLTAPPRFAAAVYGAGTLLLVGLGLFLGQRSQPCDCEDDPGHHAEDATEIVLLGTTHFAGSATDRHSSRVPDILSEERQEELDAVAEEIADWGTDRFFVECPPAGQSALDSAYRQYRDGAYDLSEADGRMGRGEIRQLGFRAAGSTGLEGLGCVDAGAYIPWSRAKEVAARHNPEVLEEYRQYSETSVSPDSLLANHSVREILLTLNSERKLWKNHRYYIHYYARMGSFDGSGADVRRESELAGSTFAAPFELPEHYRQRLRDFIGTVDGELVHEPGPETDYVIFMDRGAGEQESGPGTGADTLSVRELAGLVERTSTTWVGFPDHHIGADAVAQWYRRNLRIYANIAHAVGERDDRVVLMMGQGHIWTLREFFHANPGFEVVPVAQVL